MDSTVIFDTFFKEPDTENSSAQSQATNQEKETSYIGSLFHFFFDIN